eukprot:943687-Pelagomonas_calceolata.AAC.1
MLPCREAAGLAAGLVEGQSIKMALLIKQDFPRSIEISVVPKKKGLLRVLAVDKLLPAAGVQCTRHVTEGKLRAVFHGLWAYDTCAPYSADMARALAASDCSRIPMGSNRLSGVLYLAERTKKTGTMAFLHEAETLGSSSPRSEKMSRDCL